MISRNANLETVNPAGDVLPDKSSVSIEIVKFLANVYRLICFSVLVYSLGPIAFVVILIGSLAAAIFTSQESNEKRTINQCYGD
jgi:ABC-type Fe3+-siderophore transport system permease subunit